MYIHNVGIFVKDLEGAKAFFESYFGAKLFKTYNEPESNYYSYIMDLDGQAKLELMNKPDMYDMEKPLNRTGFIHIAFSVGSKEKVDELTENLKAAGYDVVSGPRTTGDGYYESCIVGIEGNQIEITI